MSQLLSANVVISAAVRVVLGLLMRGSILYIKHPATPMVFPERHSWGNRAEAITPNVLLPGHLEPGEGDAVLDEQSELLRF